MTRKFTCLFVFVFLCNFLIRAQSGQPDPSFGVNGFHQVNYGKGKLKATEAFMHSSGSIIAGGSQYLSNANDNAVFSFHQNGSLNTSFGINGVAIVRTSSDNDSVVQLQEMPNHNILVLSASRAMSSGIESVLFQLLPNGSLDMSFGVNGIVTWTRNTSSLMHTYPQQVAVLPDGSFLILYLAMADNYYPAIVKLLPDGSKDNSFGVNGVFVSSHTANAYLNPVSKARMHVNPDNSLLMYWVHEQGIGSPGNDSLHMEKLLPAGFRDLSFGVNGDGVMRRELINSRYSMTDGATMTDGSILIGFNQPVTSEYTNIFYYRILPDGTPLTTFGTNGLVHPTGLSGLNAMRRITPLPNGGALVAGLVQYGSMAYMEPFFQALKFDKEGQDHSYGYGGFVYYGGDGVQKMGGQLVQNSDNSSWLVGYSGEYPVDEPNWAISLTHLDESGNIGEYGYDNQVNNTRHNTEAQSLATQPDGKILIGGYSFRSSRRGLLLTRTLANGSTDASFGNNGFVHREIGRQEDVQAIKVLADGKILLAGNTFSNSFVQGIYLARFNADGSVDHSFGSGGISLPASTTNANTRSVIFQPDGKVLVGANVLGQMRVFRFLEDGSPDNTFGSSGISSCTFGLDNSMLEGLTIQPDGHILVTGTARQGINSFFGILRLLPDGSIDVSFNSTGTQTIAPYGSTNTARFSLVQPDNKIVVGGYSNTPAGQQFTVTRLNADGSIDTDFGNSGSNYISNGTLSQPNKGLLLPDGKIVMAGLSLNGASTSFMLASFNADGSINTGFGTGGVYANVNGGDAKAILFQPAGNRLFAAGRASSNSITDLLLMKVIYTPGTLPIRWGSFTAEKLNRSVQLKWTTLQEINTVDFLLQHSSNGQQWSNIGTVAASGNSGSASIYNFVHHNPVSGNNQYRILQRDTDGASTYSQIRHIQIGAAQEGLQVFGNIISEGTLRVQAPAGSAPIQLISSSGQLILKRKASGRQEHIDVSRCTNGFYFVVYGKEVKKIVIRN